MTTEELLPHIKALTEIEFANLMSELRTHIRSNKMEHTLAEAGGNNEDDVVELTMQVEDLTDEIISLKGRNRDMALEIVSYQNQKEELEKQIQDLKDKALINQSENAARGI